ncbi:hypothetical protein F5X99DRAFT_414929 [Biscogniauxia marginata]|nr:hypothetical protein F5X99DRAFT_414929 [Biscogniauxia marginata]
MPQFWDSGLCNCMSAQRSRDSSLMEDPLLLDSPQANPLEAAVERQAKKRDLWAVAKDKVLSLVRDSKHRSFGSTPVVSPPATPTSVPGAGKRKGSATTTPQTPGSVAGGDDNNKTGSSSTAAKFWGKWKGKDKDKDKDEPEQPAKGKKPKQKDPLLQWFVDSGGDAKVCTATEDSNVLNIKA